MNSSPKKTKGSMTADVIRAPAFVGDETALVKALRAGQPSAQVVLYERYAVLVRRVLFRTLGNQIDVADLINETFLEIFKSISSLKSNSSLVPWLTRVTVNTAIGYIRKQKRSRKMMVFVSPEKVPEMETQTSFDARESLREVYFLLEQMPAKERIAYALRYVDGMTFPEVAEACGVSLATAKRRVAKAVNHFEKLASNHGILSDYRESGRKWRGQ